MAAPARWTHHHGARVGFGRSLYLLLKAIRELREYRAVAGTPGIPIRIVPRGVAQIRGQAKGDAQVASAVSHTPESPSFAPLLLL